MLVMMKANATREEIDAVCRRIESMGYKPHPIPGSTRTAIGITGNREPVEPVALESLPGVGECVPVSKPYKLVGRELKEDTTVIDLGDGVAIGGRQLAVIAGPCAVESREQARLTAARVAAAGARLSGRGLAPHLPFRAWPGGLESWPRCGRSSTSRSSPGHRPSVEEVGVTPTSSDRRATAEFLPAERAGRARPVLLKRGNGDPGRTAHGGQSSSPRGTTG